MSEKTGNRGTCQGSISANTRIGTTRVVMAIMVALLMLIGATSVSAEQTPTESVKSTIDNVIQILNTDGLKQPSHWASSLSYSETCLPAQLTMSPTRRCGICLSGGSRDLPK